MVRAKRFFSTIAVGLLLCICFLFGGCAKVEGVYKFYKLSYTESGVLVEIEAGEEFMGMMTLSEDFMVLTINEDGTASLTSSAEGAAETTVGSWTKIDDKTIELTFNGEAQTCTFDGKTITIEADGTTIILKK